MGPCRPPAAFSIPCGRGADTADAREVLPVRRLEGNSYSNKKLQCSSLHASLGIPLASASKREEKELLAAHNQCRPTISGRSPARLLGHGRE